MRRLTVHITGARKTSIVTGTKTVEQKGKRKTVDVKKEILVNTLSVKDLKDTKEVESALNEIRSKHTIAIAKVTKGQWKGGQEMYYTSWQN